ncbi:hypothetical protein CDAR_32621 [Caerostris darwini]|uniref:Uncharacterized protein n=1 Tax=Caerostris darwini TaxID=1538125 RepID=A0AAV4P920_9ARAC|nr:hypothetical protein CDAR_32621 [Caerostris darwini]
MVFGLDFSNKKITSSFWAVSRLNSLLYGKRKKIPRLSEEASNIDTPVSFVPPEERREFWNNGRYSNLPSSRFRFVGVGQTGTLATLLQSLDSVNNYPNKRVKVSKSRESMQIVGKLITFYSQGRIGRYQYGSLRNGPLNMATLHGFYCSNLKR